MFTTFISFLCLKTFIKTKKYKNNILMKKIIYMIKPEQWPKGQVFPTGIHFVQNMFEN